MHSKSTFAPGRRHRVAAVVLAALTLSGCAAGGSAGAEPTASAEPQTGGDFTVGVAAFTTCFDAAQTPYVPYVQQAVVDNLLEQNKETGAIEPWLAESYEIEDNGARYVFHLKEGVTFSNGEPFNAEAVKLTFENALELGTIGKSSQASAYLLGYTGSDITDDYTIAVNFDAPKAGFEQALAEKPLGIIAPETITTKTPEERCAEGVIGSGPFVISEIVEGQKVVLDARTDYAWESPNQDHAGRPYVDTLTFQLVPEDSVRVGSVLSGQLDAINNVPALDIDRITAAGSEILARASGGVVPSFYFNYTKAIPSDEAVRKAIQTGIDRQEIIDTAYSSYDHAPTSVVSEGVPQYIDLSDELAYDPKASRKVLDDAGWTEGADGIRAKDGVRLSLALKYASAADQVPLELIQQQLKEIGIEFLITQVTQAEATESQQGLDWDIQYGNLTRPDADVLLSNYHPNYSWWLRRQGVDPYPEVTKLLEEQTVEIDPAKRAELVAQVQELLVENAYAVPIRESSQIWALSTSAHGLWLTTPWWANFSDVWVDQE